MWIVSPIVYTYLVCEFLCKCICTGQASLFVLC
uniref:Uncharacterized protein n=1 Tax=Anguilla anguilla TaxID=7936 RepID=A0A0E9PWW4_ANGAN